MLRLKISDNHHTRDCATLQIIYCTMLVQFANAYWKEDLLNSLCCTHVQSHPSAPLPFPHLDHSYMEVCLDHSNNFFLLFSFIVEVEKENKGENIKKEK